MKKVFEKLAILSLVLVVSFNTANAQSKDGKYVIVNYDETRASITEKIAKDSPIFLLLTLLNIEEEDFLDMIVPVSITFDKSEFTAETKSGAKLVASCYKERKGDIPLITDSETEESCFVVNDDNTILFGNMVFKKTE